MPPHLHAICRGERLTPEKCAAYRENWLLAVRSSAEKIEKSTVAEEKKICEHLGGIVRTEICRFCGNRGKIVEVRTCSIWGVCSVAPYRHGQPEQSCRGCSQRKEPAEASPPAPAGPEVAAPAAPEGPPPKPAKTARIAMQPAGERPEIVPLDQVPQFTGLEWRRLPEAEKRFWREQKRLRAAAGIAPKPPESAAPPPPVVLPSPEAAAPPTSPQPQATAAPTAQAVTSRGETPFLSPDGHPIHLSHIGAGGPAFVILSGPSLNSLDLSQLSRRGVWSIAVNNAATLVRPNAWTYVDPPEKFHDGIWKDPSVLKFVNRRHLTWKLRTRAPDGELVPLMDGKTLLRPKDMPGVVAINRSAEFNPSRWLAEPVINWGHGGKAWRRNPRQYPKVLNVMLCVLKIVYALGFRQAYLLGCDFSMSDAQPYAFAENKQHGAISGNNGMYPKLVSMLSLLKPHFDAAGFRVFNCNPKSYLTVFPHVPYKDAIEAATAHVPQGVLDARGWYVKSSS